MRTVSSDTYGRPNAPLQQRLDVLWRKRPAHGLTRLSASMFAQPKRSSARLTLRDSGVRDQLLYPDLSDVVLAVRAKDGDGRALETLVERHAAGVRRLAGYLLTTRRTRRMPPRRRSPSCAPGSTSSEANRSSRRGSTASCRTPAATSGARQRRRQHQPLEPVPHRQWAATSRRTLALQHDQRRALRDEPRCAVGRSAPRDGDEGRAVALLRGDRGRAADAGGHGQVPRPPRPGRGCGRRWRRCARRRGGDEPAAPLDRQAIEHIIPHRDPFLLIDEITELEPGVRAVGRYLVPADAWYLRGHFPGNPIMPGVLQVEALAQVGAVCGLSAPRFRRQARAVRGHRRHPLQAHRAARRRARPGVRDRPRLRGPVGRADARPAWPASRPAAARSPSR